MTSNELKHEAKSNRQSKPRIDMHETIVAERCATLHIGNASLDIYSGCDAEQMKMLLDEPHQPIYTFAQIYVAAGKVDFIRGSEVVMCKALSTSRW